MGIERAYKAKDILFETVQDSDAAIIAVQMPCQIKPTGKNGDTFSFFISPELFTKLAVQMAYSIQRRSILGKMWDPGASGKP